MNTTRQIFVTTILALCLFLPSVSFGEEQQVQKKYPDLVKEMVGAVKKELKKSIDIKAFKQVVDSKDYDLIVDVREPDEYEDGHIPGAISLPRGLLEFIIWKPVGFPENTDTGKKIFVYCKTGGRAALATKTLQDLGFTNVTHVNMKVGEWEESGYPMVEE